MSSSEPRRKKLTVKQKKFVKAYVANDGNGTQAALEAYNTVDEKAASVISSQNLAKVSVKESIDQALEKHGITIDAAVAPIADGLTAQKITYSDDEGTVVTPDHTIRLNASKMALKLLGAEKNDTPSSGNNIFVNGNANFNAKKYTD